MDRPNSYCRLLMDISYRFDEMVATKGTRVKLVKAYTTNYVWVHLVGNEDETFMVDTEHLRTETKAEALEELLKGAW